MDRVRQNDSSVTSFSQSARHRIGQDSLLEVEDGLESQKSHFCFSKVYNQEEAQPRSFQRKRYPSSSHFLWVFMVFVKLAQGIFKLVMDESEEPSISLELFEPVSWLMSIERFDMFYDLFRCTIFKISLKESHLTMTSQTKTEPVLNNNLFRLWII